eukprot:3332423-Rhodomonas_salina.2
MGTRSCSSRNFAQVTVRGTAVWNDRRDGPGYGDSFLRSKPGTQFPKSQGSPLKIDSAFLY